MASVSAKRRLAAQEMTRALLRVWQHRPLAQWPDQMLAALLLAHGAWQPTVKPAVPTDAEALRILGDVAAEGEAPALESRVARILRLERHRALLGERRVQEMTGAELDAAIVRELDKAGFDVA